MNETHPPRRIGQSIVAVIAGMLVGIVITLGTDVVLHAVGVFPPWGASMVGFDGPLLLATAYRLGGRLPRPCGEHCGRRRDMEQGTGLRASLVSACAHRAR
jgi:hypothetical protein